MTGCHCHLPPLRGVAVAAVVGAPLPMAEPGSAMAVVAEPLTCTNGGGEGHRRDRHPQSTPACWPSLSPTNPPSRSRRKWRLTCGFACVACVQGPVPRQQTPGGADRPPCTPTYSHWLTRQPRPELGRSRRGARRRQEPSDPPRCASPDGCEWCGEPVGPAAGCDPGLFPGWCRWGSEPWFTGEHDDFVPLPRCPDCRVGIGAAHHPPCGKAYCSTCDMQALMCDCWPDEDEEGE